MEKVEVRVVGRSFRRTAPGGLLSLSRRDARILSSLGRVEVVEDEPEREPRKGALMTPESPVENALYGVQVARLAGLPAAVVACVGGGSNAMGIFHPFVEDAGVALIGVEAAGEGIDGDRHSASLTRGAPGVLQRKRDQVAEPAGRPRRHRDRACARRGTACHGPQRTGRLSRTGRHPSPAGREPRRPLPGLPTVAEPAGHRAAAARPRGSPRRS